MLWPNLHASGLFIALCSCCGVHALSRSLRVIIAPPAPSYLSVYYTHCPGTACRSFILHRSPPPWSMEPLHFYITALLPAEPTRAHALLPGTALGFLRCVSACVKGQRCVLSLVFPGHLSCFKAPYSAVLLLIPLLLLCLRVFCLPNAIH